MWAFSLTAFRILSQSQLAGEQEGMGRASFVGKSSRMFAFVASIALNLFVSNAHAVIISSQLGSTTAGSLPYYGLGITTPAGGPWNNILFGFVGAGAPPAFYAEGDLFLLSSVYGGTPQGLSSLTPGFLAQSTGIATGIEGDLWTFESSVILDPATTYYFYMGDRPGATATGIYGAVNASSPGLYFASGEASNYQGNTNDFDHVLAGSVIPEPGVLSLLAVGLAGIGYQRRKRLTA
jgi:hypothetical protein